MENINSMMSMFNLLIGALCAYSAITGKGFAYKNEYPKEVKPEADRMMRILLAVVAPLMLFMGAEDYFSLLPDKVSYVVQLTCTAVLFLLIVAYIVWLRVKFGKILDKHNNSRSLRR